VRGKTDLGEVDAALGGGEGVALAYIGVVLAYMGIPVAVGLHADSPPL
jgi:hypothetical protein